METQNTTGVVEKERVLSKIKGLLSKTLDNGASEKEAFNAMAKADELMQVYNISLTELFVGQQECITHKFYGKGKARNHMTSCAVALANFCDCKVWSTKTWTDKSGNYKQIYTQCFFGLPKDIEMVKYLYDIIDKAAEAELANFKHTDVYRDAYAKKTASTSFLRGMMSRVSDRLNSMIKARHYTERNESIKLTGKDIVLIKKDKLESDFEKLGMKLRTTTMYSTRSNMGAYNAGSVAGGRVNLNSPIAARTSGFLT